MPPEREKELRTWEKRNKKRAPKLAKKPQLLFYQQQYLTAFLDLSRRRQFGMTELPLSVESITDYGDRFGFKGELRFFFRVISALDDEFLSFNAKKREAEKPEKPNSGKKASR